MHVLLLAGSEKWLLAGHEQHNQLAALLDEFKESWMKVLVSKAIITVG